MATQRVTIAGVAGKAGVAITALFRSWRTNPDADAVDKLCARLRANGTSLPIVYFCEWVDRWSMGDLLPGPAAVAGQRYQATCLTPHQAAGWAAQCPAQFPEQSWLATRLGEAAVAWERVAERSVVVVREILAASSDDSEVRESLGRIPSWLSGEESLT
jgi:hypothetical protein